MAKVVDQHRDNESDDDDSYDTIEFSIEDALAELEAAKASRADNRSVEEIIRTLDWCKEINAENFPELAKHPEFASILEDLGGSVAIERRINPIIGEVAYMGIVVTNPNELTLYYNPRAGDIILAEAYKGKISRHPELSLFHEIVGHCHHHHNWRNAITEGGGVNKDGHNAFARVLMDPENRYIREGFLYELRAALLTYNEEKHVSLADELTNGDLANEFLELDNDVTHKTIMEKFLSTPNGREIFNYGVKRSIGSFYHLISEKRAWQMEVDYYVERKSDEKTDEEMFSSEFEEEGWLEGAEKFKSAFMHIMLDLPDNPDSLDHGMYLSSLYRNWKRVEKRRIIRDADQVDGQQVEQIAHAVTKERIICFFNNLYELPPITKHPKDYYRSK